MSHLRIFSSQITPRLEYACHIIFKILWQIPYSIHISGQASDFGSGLNIHYGDTDNTNSYQIKPSGLVFRADIQQVGVPLTWKSETPILFPNAQNCSLGFDIFSAVFFMASRYEEYLSYIPDRYGRFPEVESLSGRFDFTHLPVVHYWADLLKESLNGHFPNMEIRKRKPVAIFTYDIDVAYAFKGRSLGQHLLSLSKDLVTGRSENLRQKLVTGFGILKDPSDTYKLLINNNLEKIFFFLLAMNRTAFDRNISPENPNLKHLIRQLSQGKNQAGIHPSYFSSEKTYLIAKEKETLEEIISQPVSASRQHYLRFRLPDTFRALLHAGIQHDYSMQYPEMPGFRAGLCLPFPFFDVQTNQITTLILHPGCIMETTFRDDLNLSAHQTLEWYLSLWEQVKKVGGQFISIWHNDTLKQHDSYMHPLNFRNIHQQLIEIIKRDMEAI